MNPQPNGQLAPVGGGDPIPLIRPKLRIGRRDSCDVCLRYPNISGEHCELSFDGYWKLTDLGSTNGTKVNGVRVQRKRLRPGDEIGIASRRFIIEYTPVAGTSTPMEDSNEEELQGISLLEKAGLVHKRRDDEMPPHRRR